MLSFPLSSKIIRTEDFKKVQDISKNVVQLMKYRKTGDFFVFQSRNDKTKSKDFINLLEKIYFVHHPSILHLYGFILSPHRIIASKYYQNGSLIQYLSDHTKSENLTPTIKSIIIFGIATAFEYLHSKQILKSPFDPSDIILSDNFRPQVQLCSITQEIVKSKSRFILSEYFTNHSYSEKTDVYTFGVILYELSADSEFNISEIDKIDISPFAKSLIKQCCSLDSSSRPSFSSIVDLLSDSNSPLFIGEDQEQVSNFYSENLEYRNMNNYFLSKKYREGKDLPCDLPLAAYLMKMAADENDPRAQFAYGKILSNGIGIEKNIKEAKKYLQMAIYQDYEKATQQLKALERREELEWPMLFQEQLLKLTSASHRSVVEMICKANQDMQATSASVLMSMIRLRPLMNQKFLRIVIDVNRKIKDYAQRISERILNDMDEFSVSFLYQMYQRGLFDLEKLIIGLSDKSIDEPEAIHNIIALFGPEIKQNANEIFYSIVNEYKIHFDEKVIRQKRSEQHPSNYILQVIRRDNPSELKALLTQNIDMEIAFDQYDPISIYLNGQTLADYAAILGSYHLFPELISETNLSKTLLKNAIHGGSIDILNKLKSIQIDFSNALKYSILFHQQKVFDWLLQNELDIWTKDLILYAAQANYIRFLLDYQVDPHFTDCDGNTAVHIAAENGSFEFLKVLVQLYQDVDLKHENNENILLIFF